MIARILLLPLLLVFAVGAQARTVTVSMGKGDMSITFPNSWSVANIARGLEAKTGDEEVYVWAEAFRESQSDELMKEHEKYFTDQGVAITGKAKSETRTIKGLNLTIVDVPATWKGDPTVLQYLLIDPGAQGDWKLLLTEWASPDGDKTYQKDLDIIVNSLTFTPY